MEEVSYVYAGVYKAVAIIYLGKKGEEIQHCFLPFVSSHLPVMEVNIKQVSKSIWVCIHL